MAHHVKELPHDRDTILYCSYPSETSTTHVAKILMNHGFKWVRFLHGGLEVWIVVGYVVVTT